MSDIIVEILNETVVTSATPTEDPVDLEVFVQKQIELQEATRVEMIEVATGIPGPPGPPGSGGGGGTAYVHDQATPSTVWDIQHDLGFDPAGIRVVATNGDQWWPGNVVYVTPGVLVRLTFPDSISGTAWVS